MGGCGPEGTKSQWWRMSQSRDLAHSTMTVVKNMVLNPGHFPREMSLQVKFTLQVLSSTRKNSHCGRRYVNYLTVVMVSPCVYVSNHHVVNLNTHNFCWKIHVSQCSPPSFFPVTVTVTPEISLKVPSYMCNMHPNRNLRNCGIAGEYLWKIRTNLHVQSLNIIT